MLGFKKDKKGRNTECLLCAVQKVGHWPLDTQA